MPAPEALTASLEDYLEAIFLIIQKKQAARSKDIASHLKVRAASVTSALRLLSDKGLINYAPYDIITLTKEGERAALDIVQKHKALYTFLKDVLRVDEQEAEQGACKLEHAISPVILKRLIAFVDFMHACPRAGSKWIDEFNSFCVHGTTGDNCEACIQDCLKNTPKK